MDNSKVTKWSDKTSLEKKCTVCSYIFYAAAVICLVVGRILNIDLFPESCIGLGVGLIVDAFSYKRKNATTARVTIFMGVVVIIISIISIFKMI